MVCMLMEEQSWRDDSGIIVLRMTVERETNLCRRLHTDPLLAGWQCVYCFADWDDQVTDLAFTHPYATTDGTACRCRRGHKLSYTHKVCSDTLFQSSDFQARSYINNTNWPYYYFMETYVHEYHSDWLVSQKYLLACTGCPSHYIIIRSSDQVMGPSANWNLFKKNWGMHLVSCESRRSTFFFLRFK